MGVPGATCVILTSVGLVPAGAPLAIHTSLTTALEPDDLLLALSKVMARPALPLA